MVTGSPVRAGHRPVLLWLLAALSISLAATVADAQSVTRGPYLQLGTDSSIVVRWRTDVATGSRVRYGSTPATLSDFVQQGGSRTEHEIELTGLQPGTRYFYSVGAPSQPLAGGDASHFFNTAPLPGVPQPTRIWVLGDAGTANADAAAVRDAYMTLTDAQTTHLWLMLGDNAYFDGTDSEYQVALFDMFPEMLRKAVLWPTIGNHDGASSSSSSETGPYFDMFTLPRVGEVGGVASGTEAYYSFDYANVHFVVLDSYGTSRTTGSPMLAWLQNDLALTGQDWIIALWHHPPYSKGSHDSDDDVIDLPLVEMRENAVAILEEYGVDLVLSGHSHSYERSFLIDGHYGTSDTFGPEHVVDGGDGRTTGDGAYVKPIYGGRQGAVYTVAGNAGRISGGTLDHPAMYVSINELGSLILQLAGDTLDATFLNSTGDVRDTFRLVKTSETVADFSATPPTGPAPLVVEFADESLVTATSWSWDFDNDGTVDSTQEQPTFEYPLPGSYAVRLTITSAQGVFERIKPAAVVATLLPPLAEFTANRVLGAVPLTVEFTDLSTRLPAAWDWDFDGDAVIDSTARHPSWTFTEPGTYSVTLTARNPAGSGVKTKTDYIVVTPRVPGEITNFLFDTDPAEFFWDAQVDSCFYDVVRGDLVALRSSDGQFETTQLGCAAHETSLPWSQDAATPAPGEAFYFVVRGVTCTGDPGTYDTSNPFQLQSRDLKLQGPAAACGCNPASDLDGDGFCDPYDRCPTVPNLDQADQDEDGFGDECDCDPLNDRCTTDCTDVDGDQFCLTTDCDDQSAETFPGAAPNDDPAACMADEDLDEWGDTTPLPLVTPGSDCDDDDPGINPTTTWYADVDGDGFGDAAGSFVGCVPPAGHLLDSSDCNDSQSAAFPGAAPNDSGSACMKDADGDGWGDEAPPAGVTPGTDCDDESPTAAQAFPGAAPNDSGSACMKDADDDDWGDEAPPAGVAAGTDCDDADADLTPTAAWYADLDADGFGDLFVSLTQCLPPAGYVPDSTDCDDISATAAVTFPGAAPSDDPLACMKDLDDDDWGDSEPLPGVVPGSDCVDDDPARGPSSAWFTDTDADSFGDVTMLLLQCEQPAGHVADNTDCDDSSTTAAAAFPGAAPNDSASACMKDADGDDWGDTSPPPGVSTGTDCDDDSPAAASTFPGAAPNDGPGCLLDADGDDWGDADPVAEISPGTDCDDAAPDVNPSTVWYRDADLDGYGDLAVSLTQCEQPAGYLLDGTDCDDTSPTAASTYRGAAPGDSALACMKDVDDDDFGDSAPPAGVTPGSDCNDGDDAINKFTPWYADTDGDGFGDPAEMTESCLAPEDHVSNTDDCDDTSPTAATTYPGAAANDSGTACMNDADGDGWGDDAPPAGVAAGSDCDDDSATAASTFPGAASNDSGSACMLDVDGDDWGDDAPPAGVTPGTDCDDLDDSRTPQSIWYADGDGDGYGTLFVSVTQCAQPAGYVTDSTDCDDQSASAAVTFPGAAPNDDSFVCMKDADGDGWGDNAPPAGVVPGSDCADDDADRGPTSAWFADTDGDGFGDVSVMLVQCDQPAGFVFDNTDCDDTSTTAASAFPGAAPNDGAAACMKDVDDDDWGDAAPPAGVGVGTDCDDDSPTAASTFPGAAPSDGPGCLLDADGDDWGDDAPPAGVPAGTDCDDADAELNPATVWYRDADLDGFGDVAVSLSQCEEPAGYLLDSTDCDDTSATAAATFPGAAPNDSAEACMRDVDGDDWGDLTPDAGVIAGTDCDDANVARNPTTAWFADTDGDGFGDIDVTLVQCAQPAAYVLDTTDCDDTSTTAGSTFPGAAPNDHATDCMKDVDDDGYGDDSPPAGVVNGSDCDDTNGVITPQTSWYVDTDGDTFGDPNVSLVQCAQPAGHLLDNTDCDDTSPTAGFTFPGAAPNDGATACMKDFDGDDWGDTDPPAGVAAGGDCNDADGARNPATPWRADTDGDGYGDPAVEVLQCPEPPGFVLNADDCDDTSITAAATYPGAASIESASACMKDVDSDGYGDTNPPAGVVTGSDCDDVDVASNPGASEVCDGNDNNCDATVPLDEIDNDGDLRVECTAWNDTQGDQSEILGGDDCADGDANSYPGASELCDGNDNNCDTVVPADEIDNDGDFYVECTSWNDTQSDQGAILGGDDCTDSDPASNPGASELCDGNDNNCDTVVPVDEIDNDGDSYVECTAWNDSQGDQSGINGGDDCDDVDPASNPGASEVCDGNDNNCDATVPLDEIDNDGDLRVECTAWNDTQGDQSEILGGDDCADGDANSYPGASELCDGNDNNCDTVVPADEIDNDGDFYVECTSWNDTQSDQGAILGGDDCTDSDPASNPGASELCDGNDNNCDTVVPVDEIDNDGDSYVECTAWNDSQGDQSGINGGDDCDDVDPASNPGASEVCDGNDNNCDATVPLDEIDNDGDLRVECTAWNDTQGDQSGILGGDDCADGDANSYPGASELCDGNDNNCDTVVPADEIDNDGDFYVECTSWNDTQSDQGAILGGDDCTDSDPASNPGASELCDGNDNNCDTVVPVDEIDNDGDSYVECTAWNDSQGDQSGINGGDDCDDVDPASNPGASEVCDGNDNNCDATVPLDEIDNDGDLRVECTAWNDTQGDQSEILGGDDCADGDANSYPGASELCDGNDNDCDTVVPADEIDNDGDFYVECTSWNDTQSDQGAILGGDDCTDSDPASNPGASELCDGNDNNCDTVVPVDEIDNDGDSYVECTAWNDSQGDQSGINGGDDCDDVDPASNPGASEVCDGNDNNCDTVVPADEIDNDGDFYVECTAWNDTQADQGSILGGADCDDTSGTAASTFPGAAGSDSTTLCMKDVDDDGYGDASPPGGVEPGTDCDDGDSTSNPAASEVCDGNDNNCDTVVPADEIDNDGDLYVECTPWSDTQSDQGSILGGADCDDGDPASNPGASEVCDGNDNNCDTVVPADEIDNDGDLRVECAAWNDTQGDQSGILGGDDCADGDANSYPGASELCDGNDNDCDTVVPLTEIDNDGDSYVECAPWSDTQSDQGSILGGADCDDSDPASNPGASEVCDGNDNNCDTVIPADEIDNDGDLYVECTPWNDTQADQGSILGGADCDDTSGTAASTFPGAAGSDSTTLCMKDVDDDGYGDASPPSGVDPGTDCDDGDSTSHPTASEVCDGNDNDCDTVVPLTEIDNDGDSYVECTAWNDSQGDQSGINGGDDCDDVDPASNPGASEVCDGNDNNCDTVVPADEIDNDGDLYVECTPWNDTQADQGSILGGADCDDTSGTAAATFPGAAGSDSTTLCMKDVDDDGYGDASPPGGVDPGTDCDDGDSTSHPTASEVCDGNDNDCDTVVPADEIDNDGDFYVECTPWSDTQSDQGSILGGADCDDGDPASNPGASELCDGNDNDCDTVVPVDEIDNDGDLRVECASWNDTQGDQSGILGGDDCADGDANSYPGASELCDGNDNDCDTVVPLTEIDNDGDSYVECTAWNDSQGDQSGINGGDDCDDVDPASNPGASEVCDGNDNNCDTVVPADEIDNDGDLYVECTPWNDTQADQGSILGGADCDDTSGTAASTFPGAAGSDSTTLCMKDVDDDGYGDASPPGGVDPGTDCDDGDSTSHPTASEVCDGNDNNCDTVVPADEIDNDGDLYVECTPWNDTQADQGSILGGADCDDGDPASNPGASELCDGNDNDCDTVVPLTEIDNDGDLYVECTPWNDTQADQGSILGGADCDDTSGTAAATFPGAAGSDSTTLCMKDVDDDGYGDASPPGGVEPGTDCDDGDSTSNPGASEVCDGNDNDCDTVVPADEIDNDGDLYVECTPWNDTQADQGSILGGADCDDTSGTAASTFPGAAGSDSTTLCMKDVDDDGYGDASPPSGVDPGTDCDDGDSTSHPTASEVCDGNDNDCDTVVPLTEIDNDGDLYVECTPWNDTQSDQGSILGGADCDDGDPASNPGASELCDGNDNDCDTVVPVDEIDNDGDLYVECTPWNDTQADQGSILGGADCDDTSGTAASTFPGAAGSDSTTLCMKDVDDDGYGDASPPGGVDSGTDCDDGDSTSNPAASEVCDGNDNNCDTVVPADEIDNDGDFYVECTPWIDTQADQGSILGGADCDDTSGTAASTFPGAAGSDSTTLCMKDVDDDGYGDASPPGGVEPGTDCDDGDSTSNPAASEVCDGNDNNCDTVVPADEIDNDGDLYVECTPWNDTQADQGSILGGGDCDDTGGTAGSIFPGAASNDSTTSCMEDVDGDDYGDDSPPANVTAGTDCNDADAAIDPDTIWYADTDADTYGDPSVTSTQCAQPASYVLDNTDCDDTGTTAASIFPGAAPNDSTTACMEDVDGDDYGDESPPAGVTAGNDCDDSNPAKFPGAGCP